MTLVTYLKTYRRMAIHRTKEEVVVNTILSLIHHRVSLLLHVLKDELLLGEMGFRIVENHIFVVSFWSSKVPVNI